MLNIFYRKTGDIASKNRENYTGDTLGCGFFNMTRIK